MFNFHGRNKIPGFGFYFDGKRQTSETQKLYHFRYPKGTNRIARDGKIVLGRLVTDDFETFERYGTFVIDELLFFNRVVTEAEIKMLSRGSE